MNLRKCLLKGLAMVVGVACFAAGDSAQAASPFSPNPFTVTVQVYPVNGHGISASIPASFENSYNDWALTGSGLQAIRQTASAKSATWRATVLNTNAATGTLKHIDKFDNVYSGDILFQRDSANQHLTLNRIFNSIAIYNADGTLNTNAAVYFGPKGAGGNLNNLTRCLGSTYNTFDFPYYSGTTRNKYSLYIRETAGYLVELPDTSGGWWGQYGVFQYQLQPATKKSSSITANGAKAVNGKVVEGKIMIKEKREPKLFELKKSDG